MGVPPGAVIILTASGPMDLLVATANPGKTREIRLALDGLDVHLVTLAEVAPALEAPEETGATFTANAALKAHFYARRTGLPTLAEDSGLSIDVLGGRPGVQSARYPGATYAHKFAGLYRELTPFSRPWTACFTSALVVVSLRPANPIADFSGLGVVHGEIARTPRGAHGFGYDPIFFFPPYGCTTAELTDAEKLGISHRGHALRALREWMKGRV